MKKLITILLCAPIAASAQFIEDGLRLAEVNSAITARAAGLGVSYIGINDDAAALRINPAGLSLIPANEFNVGFAFRNAQTTTQYNGENFAQTPTNSFYLSNIVLTAPFGADNENTVAFGYFNEAQNDGRVEYNTFNEKADGSFFNFNRNTGEDLFVAPNNNTVLITDSIQQDNFTSIEGGKHSLYFGGAFKVLESIHLGFNIAPKFGSIRVDRLYSEFDVTNKYNQISQDLSSVDFNNFQSVESLVQDYTGVTGAVGFQVNYSDFLRFGGGIELPSYYLIEETYSTTQTVNFDNDDYENSEAFFENRYDVVTPAVFSGGASLHFLGATVTAGISYSDFSQMEFGGVDGEADGEVLTNLNRSILEQLKGRTTYGVGAEFQLPGLPVVARASYEHFVSPFYEDGPEASGSTYAMGGTLRVGEQMSIDGTFRYRDFNNVSVYPGGGNFINNIEQPLTIALGITYRF